METLWSEHEVYGTSKALQTVTKFKFIFRNYFMTIISSARHWHTLLIPPYVKLPPYRAGFYF